jgi:uncharacterized protein
MGGKGKWWQGWTRSVGMVCLLLPCWVVAPAARAELFSPDMERLGFGAGQSHATRGVMYRISHEGRTGYLFGTLHVGMDAFYPLAPVVGGALAHADALVVELDTGDEAPYQRALLRRASYAGQDSVDRHLRPDTLAELTGALHAVGIPLSSVEHLKPWLLANLLLGMQLERSGYRRSEGIDAFLLASAKKRGTAVIALESADYQLALFDTLGEADAERYLRESLRELEDGSALRKAQAFIAAWYSGDAHAIDALLPDATGAASLVARFTQHTLLARRNPEMAARIARIVDENRVTFVGVGLLHLLGANGVPALLAQRGYRIERVY